MNEYGNTDNDAIIRAKNKLIKENEKQKRKNEGKHSHTNGFEFILINSRFYFTYNFLV